MADAGVPTAVAAEVAAVAERYRLALGGRRFRGRLGGRSGHGPGSSLEFHDFRDYRPGDDLRYLDWRGYARTEQLRVRLHQEEVAPHCELVVDTSASMACTEGKERAARLLLAACERWARRSGMVPRLLQLGGGVVDAAMLQFDRADAAPAAPAVPLRPGGVRVLLADALWEQDPLPLLRSLAAGASVWFVVQLLDPWELAPSGDGALTLVDVETGARREVQLDAASKARYAAGLQRLCGALADGVLGLGGRTCRVAAADLATMCRRDLLPGGLLEPA